MDLENVIKHCLRDTNADRDTSCDKSKIEKVVNKNDGLIQNLLEVAKSVETVIIKRTQTHVDSLINRIVSIPVSKCMKMSNK